MAEQTKGPLCPGQALGRQPFEERSKASCQAFLCGWPTAPPQNGSMRTPSCFDPVAPSSPSARPRFERLASSTSLGSRTGCRNLIQSRSRGLDSQGLSPLTARRGEKNAGGPWIFSGDHRHFGQSVHNQGQNKTTRTCARVCVCVCGAKSWGCCLFQNAVWKVEVGVFPQGLSPTLNVP